MGGLGVQELVLLIVLSASIYLIVKLLKNVSVIEAWFTKRLEARFLAKHYGTVKVEHRPHSKLWWLPLPFALIPVAVMYLASLVIAIAFVRSEGILPSSVQSKIDLVVNGVAYGFVIIGLLIHFRPGGNRKVKYEFLVAGTSILSTGFFLLVAKAISYAVRSPLQWWQSPHFDLDPTILIWTIIAHLVFLVSVQLVFALWVGSPGTEGKTPPPSSHIRRYYRLVRRAGYGFALFSFSGLTQPLLTVYLILRYVLGERMSDAPILYLRSFHYSEGPTAFGKIVARVASRYGVLLALVHQTQGPLELHAETRLTERAVLSQVPDETWQNWIDAQMVRASAIIIDRSVDTQGLSWELDRAMILVDPSKILLLNKKGVAGHTPLNVWNLEYDRGPESEEYARNKLDERLRALLLAP